jgi:hypothetical protein
MGGVASSSHQPATANPAALTSWWGRHYVGGELAVNSSLADRGFVHFDAGSILNVAEDDQWLIELQAAFGDLPRDPYAVRAGRFRRYARAVLFPWCGRLEWIPPVDDRMHGPMVQYDQGQFNPEFATATRWFQALSEEVRDNLLLRRLVHFDYDQTFWALHERALPVHVGVHLVKLAADEENEEATSSPDCLHQDGERFTFVHCIVRRNIVGGLNAIASSHCAGRNPHEVSPDEQLATFVLARPLDSYAVHDPQVSHHVGSVRRAEGSASGERGVLLVDFTPLTTAT